MYNGIIGKIADKSVRNNKNEGDFYNSDGFLMCGKCGKRKEMEIEFPKGFKRIVGVTCGCDIQAEKEYQERKRREKFDDYVASLYKSGLTDKAYLSRTFSRDDGRNPEIKNLCQKYVENWEKMKESSVGILFYGDVGAGKSYFACCIANALLEKGVRALVTRLSDLVRNRTEPDEKTVKLKSFELIVLDDLGVENYSQTAYNIVDDIYRSGIPVIATTNLAPSEIKNPSDMGRKRIYDRIIERCCITRKVSANSGRLEKARLKKAAALRLLGEI